MHPFFARIPLVRLLLPLIAGISLGWLLRPDLPFTLLIFILAVCISLLYFQKKMLRATLRPRGLDGLVLFVALFSIGIWITVFRISSSAKLASNGNYFLLELKNDPVARERTVKFPALILSVKDSSGKWNSAGENIMVYLQRDPSAAALHYGDRILVQGSPHFVDGPKNPDEFDYRSFLERQGIYRQVYSATGSWQRAGEGGSVFRSAALDLRRWFMQQLHTSGLSGEEYGVASALLLGASDQLDPGLLQAYSVSGTLHVLSVSGMHVALVYIVLMRLLAPLEKRRYGRWISAVIQLVFIWFYATLTGLCPSVLRAVTMLSVVIAGRSFNRQAHVLNSLAASALILLLINPLLLFDIGFQLSYLAVAGIVLLHPGFEQKWRPRIWILRQAWTLISVTIVAQLFTFPLGLYYFRQFPTYFLVSNLFVIPLSALVMYTGLFLLLVSPWKWLGGIVAAVLAFLIRLLDNSVRMIESWPGASAHTAGWTKGDILFLYLLVAGLLVFLWKKRPRSLQLALGATFFLLVGTACRQKEWLGDSRVVVFSLNRSSAIAVVHGTENILLADTALLHREGDLDFHVSPFFESRGIYHEPVRLLSDTLDLQEKFVHAGHNWLFAAGESFFIAGKNTALASAAGSCDVLLLRENTPLHLDSLIRRLHPATVVCDGSNGKKKKKHWHSLCDSCRIPFYDVREQGAFTVLQAPASVVR